MSIVIPTKNIYGKTQKLPKTFISSVEGKNHDLQYSIDYYTLVETQEHDFSQDESWKTNKNNNSGYKDGYSGPTNAPQLIREGVFYIFVYYASIKFVINKFRNHKLYEILKLYGGTSEKKIEYNVTYNLFEGKSTLKEEAKNKGDGDLAEEDFDFIYDAEPVTEQTINKEIETEKTFTLENEGDTTDIFVSVENKENITSASATLNKDGNYEIELTIKVGNRTAGFKRDNTTKEHWALTSTLKTPLSLSVSFYGDVGEYEKVEIPFSVGSGENVFPIETNELFQSDTTIDDIYAYSAISSGIINNYKNGKETLELLCSIGEYYDESGNLVISTKENSLPMSFKIGDSILPYKTSISGEMPISLYKNGTPKRFLITAVDFIYDGAAMQKITSQEI